MNYRQRIRSMQRRMRALGIDPKAAAPAARHGDTATSRVAVMNLLADQAGIGMCGVASLVRCGALLPIDRRFSK